MNVLVIGGGGREHALAWKIAQSNKVQKVFVAPGNGGTARDKRLDNLDITDVRALREFAQANSVELTVVGPETPLAAGVVDGTENPISNFYTQKMHEVQSDLSLTEHGYLGYAVVTNERLWRHLKSTDRELIHQALREALAFANQSADTQNQQALQALRQAGTTRIHSLNQEQRTRLRRAVQAVQQQLADRIGNGWIKALQQVLSQG